MDTTDPSPSAPTPPAEVPGPDDPRSAFAQVTGSVGALIAAVPATALGDPTPCEDFTVKQLLEHLVLVMRRVAVIGEGQHWSAVQHEALADGFHDAFRAGAHDVMAAWTDGTKLGQTYEVPWGEMPGAPMILMYTAELAVHGWDLATATHQDLVIEDGVLEGAWAAARFIPAEGRTATAEMPFGPVVDPGSEAPLLLRLAGWMGRDVVAGAAS